MSLNTTVQLPAMVPKTKASTRDVPIPAHRLLSVSLNPSPTVTDSVAGQIDHRTPVGIPDEDWWTDTLPIAVRAHSCCSSDLGQIPNRLVSHTASNIKASENGSPASRIQKNGLPPRGIEPLLPA